MSDKLQDTLSALSRGEKPNCPWCGAEYSYTGKRIHAWSCDAQVYAEQEGPSWTRCTESYERDLVSLRAECERLRDIVRGVIEMADKIVDTHKCSEKNVRELAFFLSSALARKGDEQ